MPQSATAITTDHICECCEEHLATHHDGCQWICAECSFDPMCPVCGMIETGGELCERCEKMERRSRFMAETEAELERIAAAYGWNIEHRSQAQTGSRYYELNRGGDTVRVRISDHQTCYESEDFSIEISGDGHSIKQIEHRLAQ